MKQVRNTAEELPVVTITKNGETYLAEKPVNINVLGDTIRRRYPNQKGVYLRADKGTVWDPIAQVISELGEVETRCSSGNAAGGRSGPQREVMTRSMPTFWMNASRCGIRCSARLRSIVGIVALASIVCRCDPRFRSRALGRSQVAGWRRCRHHSGGAHPDSVRDRAASTRSRMTPSRRFRPRPQSRSRSRRSAKTRMRSRLKSRNSQKKPAPQTTPQKYSSDSRAASRIRSIAARGRRRHRRCSARLPAAAESAPGSSSPFGNRFGYYEQLLRDKVARNWRSQELDAIRPQPCGRDCSISCATAVFRTFGCRRPAGISPLDQSAQRAILMSNPFPPLPAQYERDVATIEFWFRLQ